MTWVMALDPGKTTGIASLRIEDGEFVSKQTNFDETVAIVQKAATTNREELTLVSESFIITQQTAKNTQATWSLELIGFCRAMARMHTGRDLVLQAPSQAKRFSSDERLKIMGWYIPGQGHANDAARHLMLFCVSRGLIDVKKLVLP